jgi:hypothetical protein
MLLCSKSDSKSHINVSGNHWVIKSHPLPNDPEPLIRPEECQLIQIH